MNSESSTTHQPDDKASSVTDARHLALMQRLESLEKELKLAKSVMNSARGHGPTFWAALLAAFFASLAVPWDQVRTQAAALLREARVTMETHSARRSQNIQPSYRGTAHPKFNEPVLPAAVDAPLSDALILLPEL